MAIKQAGFVGCPTDNLDAAIECLKKVPHQQLSDTVASKFAVRMYIIRRISCLVRETATLI